MIARINLLATRPKGRWPKAHWFFDGTRGTVLTAACGIKANEAVMYAPPASYYLAAITEGWCKKCRMWKRRHQDEIAVGERLMKGEDQ